MGLGLLCDMSDDRYGFWVFGFRTHRLRVYGCRAYVLVYWLCAYGFHF